MRKPNNYGLLFPTIPTRWGEEERRFAFSLRDLLEQTRWQLAYPVGSVALSVRTSETGTPVKPFGFGEWEQVTTDLVGIYAWKRVR